MVSEWDEPRVHIANRLVRAETASTRMDPCLDYFGEAADEYDHESRHDGYSIVAGEEIRFRSLSQTSGQETEIRLPLEALLNSELD